MNVTLSFSTFAFQIEDTAQTLRFKSVLTVTFSCCFLWSQRFVNVDMFFSEKQSSFHGPKFKMDEWMRPKPVACN